MSAFSNEMEAKIVLHFLVGTTQTASTNLYLALFTADPGESGFASEATYTGYTARQPITFTQIDGSGNTMNDGAVSFPANTGTTQVIRYAAVYDTSVPGTGTMVIHGQLAADKTLDNGDVLAFADNALVLNVN